MACAAQIYRLRTALVAVTHHADGFSSKNPRIGLPLLEKSRHYDASSAGYNSMCRSL
jgi:hypothetical protein